MTSPARPRNHGAWLLLAALALTIFVYWPGLWGGWVFDDYPNIVENPGIQITHVDMASLTGAALSSPSSIFKRPLASLTFAANYLASGLHPFWWKVTNLVIHLLNGVLVFLLARALLLLTGVGGNRAPPGASADFHIAPDAQEKAQAAIVAALIAAAWMLLPINLTGVLYVVQRMASMANLFVLLGLLGYIAGRRRMLGMHASGTAAEPRHERRSYRTGMTLCAVSLVLATIIGGTAKETAVMLPLYAFLIEWIVFGFRMARPCPPLPDQVSGDAAGNSGRSGKPHRDRYLVVLFALVLVVPLIVGLTWLVPQVLSHLDWSTRDFTLRTRLLSEARIVVGYIVWTLVPLPHWLSFYHDDYHISTGLLHPWNTLPSILVLIGLVVTVFKLRRRWPLVALGIALFLGCHLLTGTILPLELIYEHRNYFASFGLMLALVPLFAVSPSRHFARLRWTVLGVALLAWATLTASTAYAWGNPLRLARELAARAPDSPRAQYELGRSYIVASHYNPDSPYTPLVYPPLEHAAELPNSSILPQQALIFFNARMHRPIKSIWWDSLIASLRRRKPGVQDESSLAALAKCAREGLCPLSTKRMREAFQAAISHPHTSARLWADYGDYAWNVLGDHKLGLRLTEHAVKAAFNVPAYHITLARMFVVDGNLQAARKQIHALQGLNIGGRLDGSISSLRDRVSNARCDQASCADAQD